jgi:hypothetical protein
MDGVRPVNRRAFTVHEMLVSLVVMSAAVGLAAHAAVGLLRFYHGVGEIVAVRSHTAEVGAIVAGALWGVSAANGDVRAATDSALEVLAPSGAAAVCDAAPGQVTIPASTPRGNALAAFDQPAEAGDVAHIMVSDSAGARWVSATVVDAGGEAGPCAAFPAAVAARRLYLDAPLLVPRGSVLRVARPVRLSHYRASDGWYFGVRDWNGVTQRFNTIQPVAGPLEPHSADKSRSGLVFRYADHAGQELTPPVAVERIARVDVVTRARARRPVRVDGLAGSVSGFADSSVTVVALRNGR